MKVDQQFAFVGAPFVVAARMPEDPLAIVEPLLNQTAIDALQDLEVA
jgi:hypothetical protein